MDESLAAPSTASRDLRSLQQAIEAELLADEARQQRREHELHGEVAELDAEPAAGDNVLAKRRALRCLSSTNGRTRRS
jgi:hypothetical protein